MAGTTQGTARFPMTRQGVRDLDAVGRPVPPGSGGPAPQAAGRTNVGGNERVVSSVGGAALVLLGLARRTMPGLALALAGGALLYRGLGGHCPLFAALGLDTAGAQPASSQEIVNRAV